MDETKEESPKISKTSNPAVYVIFATVLLAGIGGAYWYGKHSVKPQTVTEQPGTQGVTRTGPPSLKGQKFSDTNLYANAFLIAPGTPSEAARAAMSGWQLSSRSLSDGSTQVDLIPVGSEATEGDTAHTFNLKTGDQLYFADINPNDDNSGADINKNDDMGIIVGADGIVK